MEIGIGLPSTIPGAPGALLLDWAREAERRGFSSLATIDRLVYPSYDPLTALTAAAAVTDRIRLTTAITLPLLHGSAAAFAKQAASMDALSGGRLVLGLAAGARQDDFDLAGVDFHRRGQILDAALEQMTELWSADPPVPTGPALRPGGPPLLVGGTAKAAIRRTVTYGAGWIMGGGSPDQFREFAGTVRSAWTEAGRSGSPRLVALAYFGLGPDARNGAESYLGDYYAFLGMPPEALAGMAALGDEAVRGVVDGFRAEGCDELLLFPCVPELGQVEHLARVTGLS
jgi:alkanesulfonate monooxygenase SsuD/methylene tetrahydromethanopterin reductase-like flavin-dependent oxidoreductase (luciferase family)